MKPNVIPSVPPALRKARPAKELSDAFPPIVARPRPEPSPPAPAAEIPPAPPAPPTPTPTPEPSPVPSKPAPLPPAKPAAPAPLPPVKPVLAAPVTRPKPVITGRPPVAALDGKVVLFEGTFRSDENPSFTVETPLTGNAAKDKQSLINIARRRYSTGRMELKSTRIFSREIGAGVTFPRGCTVGQLFGPPGSATEAAIEIGNVFYGGARCQVMLVNLRSRSSVTINLRPPGAGKIAFSNHIPANTPAVNLKVIAKEVIGRDARELEITLRVEK